MRRVFPVAIAIALLLLIAALYRPTGPLLVPTPDVRQLVELVKSDPDLRWLIHPYAEELEIQLPVKQQKPILTNITLHVQPNKVVAGGAVVASGILNTSRGPLPRQLVVIYVDKTLATFDTTDDKGRFQAELRIGVYKPQVEIRAVYKPLPGSRTWSPTPQPQWRCYTTRRACASQPPPSQVGRCADYLHTPRPPNTARSTHLSGREHLRR